MTPSSAINLLASLASDRERSRDEQLAIAEATQFLAALAFQLLPTAGNTGAEFEALQKMQSSALAVVNTMRACDEAKTNFHRVLEQR